MGKIPRAYSESGVYHILFRGLNQQNIFEEKADYDKLKDDLLAIKEEMGFETCQKCTSPNGSNGSRPQMAHLNPAYMENIDKKWYVLFFYVLNFVMVGIDLCLYYRNRMLDRRNTD